MQSANNLIVKDQDTNWNTKLFESEIEVAAVKRPFLSATGLDMYQRHSKAANKMQITKIFGYADRKNEIRNDSIYAG